ncbi:SusD family protein [compost metagenome]
MKKLINMALICGVLITALGCRKYVEIDPEQARELKYYNDYEQLLNNGNAVVASHNLAIYSGDDCGTESAAWQTNSITWVRAAYSWAVNFYTDQEEDQEWASLYKQLYIFNTIVTEVDASLNGTDTQKSGLKAAAKVHRAYNYYMLVNTYGKQYDAATASSDLGVPMILEPKFTQSLQRATVAVVYAQIESDLTTALADLPNLPQFNTQPSKAAVYALLARVHLAKRNFSEAKRYAELALNLQSTLLNLNDYLVTNVRHPQRIANAEEIFFKAPQSYPNGFPMSASLQALLGTQDLRYVLYTVEGTAIQWSNLTGRAFNRSNIVADAVPVGLGVPEMMLIKAECDARANNAAAAVTTLNTLRRNRFKPTEYADLAASSAEQALRLVIEERTREFMGRGFRWYDQKRLSKDAGLVPTITRTYQGQTLSLAPNSPRYTFPIGGKYILLNPEITQNPR